MQRLKLATNNIYYNSKSYNYVENTMEQILSLLQKKQTTIVRTPKHHLVPQKTNPSPSWMTKPNNLYLSSMNHSSMYSFQQPPHHITDTTTTKITNYNHSTPSPVWNSIVGGVPSIFNPLHKNTKSPPLIPNGFINYNNNSSTPIFNMTNRNTRIAKKANKGKRPCSRVGRRRKSRAYGNSKRG